jgi:hypothetical protein
MSLSEFNSLFDKAIQEERYLEAFLVKSLYIESIITILATAKVFHDKGFDGTTLSLVVEVKKDIDTKKLLEKSIRDKLSNNIGILRGAHFMKAKQADYLYTWKDKYRDNIFHNFGELMLRGDLTSLAQEGLNFTKKFTDQEWFKNMEKSFGESELQFKALEWSSWLLKKF